MTSGVIASFLFILFPHCDQHGFLFYIQQSIDPVETDIGEVHDTQMTNQKPSHPKKGKTLLLDEKFEYLATEQTLTPLAYFHISESYLILAWLAFLFVNLRKRRKNHASIQGNNNLAGVPQISPKR